MTHISKPILFNGEMVQAILDGRKTETRRIINIQQLRVLDSQYRKAHPEKPDKAVIERLCAPPCFSGDILYVRETWAKQSGLYWHKAGLKLDENGRAYRGTVPPEKWRPSIYMPKEAARIFLRVTGVRVERLQDITQEDISKEGAEARTISTVRAEARPALFEFQNLWDSTIKTKDIELYGWDANPWVWVILFERISQEEAERDA